MKGYSKIGFVKRNKSKSMDISDLPSSPLTPKRVKKPPISKNTTTKPISPSSQPGSQIPKQMRKPVIIYQQHSGPKKQEGQGEEEEEEGGGAESEEGKRVESFGAALRRNCSVSSNSSSSSNSFSSTVKRAFSLRRSSSVSERYSRIHDQPAFLASPIDDCEEGMETRSLSTKKQKKGKITKAWKKLFGL